MTEGFTNNEISEQLSISPHTVKSHVIHIFNKLSVDDRTQAAVLATRHKLI
jgi:DNA-binding NarL/FixJ family response regulator